MEFMRDRIFTLVPPNSRWCRIYSNSAIVAAWILMFIAKTFKDFNYMHQGEKCIFAAVYKKYIFLCKYIFFFMKKSTYKYFRHTYRIQSYTWYNWQKLYIFDKHQKIYTCSNFTRKKNRLSCWYPPRYWQAGERSNLKKKSCALFWQKTI